MCKIILTPYIAALTVFSASAAVGAAQPVSLSGIAIGQPLAIPECPPTEQREMCYQRGPGTRLETVGSVTSGDRRLAVYFVAGALPSIAAKRFFEIRLSDGIVEQIIIETKGVSVQDDALRQLGEKFGKPKMLNLYAVQNGFGAKYEKAIAEWQLGSDTVQFSGTSDRIDQGMLTAMTAKALADVRRSINKGPAL